MVLVSVNFRECAANAKDDPVTRISVYLKVSWRVNLRNQKPVEDVGCKKSFRDAPHTRSQAIDGSGSVRHLG